jgi:hypothetical protein
MLACNNQKLTRYIYFGSYQAVSPHPDASQALALAIPTVNL